MQRARRKARAWRYWSVSSKWHQEAITKNGNERDLSMAVEDVLARCRRNHQSVLFQRVVETVEIVVKEKTHRLEVYEASGRYGYNVNQLFESEDRDLQAWSLTRYSKAEYTSSEFALAAALQSLGYRV